MASGRIQTIHQHSDYRIQQEFERINRQLTTTDKAVKVIDAFTGGLVSNPISDIPNVNQMQPWALTVAKNSKVIDNKKKVQEIDFKNGRPVPDETSFRDVIWDIKRLDLEKDLRSIETDNELTKVEIRGRVSVPTYNFTAMNVGHIERYFDYTTITPYYLGEIPANSAVHNVTLDIIDAFDSNIYLRIGDNSFNGKLMMYNDNYPYLIGSYYWFANYVYTSTTKIYLYIQNIPTQGSGRLILYYS